MSTIIPLATIIPSAELCARSSAIFILKPWLPLVAFARLQQEHTSCKLGTSSLPSSLGAKKPMVERRKPIVTEWALADALYQLVNLIEELQTDVDLHMEITTDDTQLLKISFSGTPDVGFPLQRKVRDLPGQVCAASGTRASATTTPVPFRRRDLRRSARDTPGLHTPTGRFR